MKLHSYFLVRRESHNRRSLRSWYMNEVQSFTVSYTHTHTHAR